MKTASLAQSTRCTTREGVELVAAIEKGTMTEDAMLMVNGFLLGATFLGFTLPTSLPSNASQVDDYRAAVACDVFSFICFLISIIAAVCRRWGETVISNHKVSGLFLWFVRGMLQSLVAPLASFLGMMLLVASACCVVQAALGTAAQRHDSLSVILVSFLSFAAVIAVAMVGLTILWSLFEIGAVGRTNEDESEEEGEEQVA